MNETDVKQDSVSNESKPEDTVVSSASQGKPGEKTDPALLLKSLHEEREKRRIAEEALAEINAQKSDNLGGAFSEEGKVLEDQIKAVRKQLDDLNFKEQLMQVQTSFPAVKDKADEFEEFRNLPENKGMSLATAAKAFVYEKDLVEKPTRSGLEQGTGGVRVPQSPGMSPEEVDNLRNTNYREFVRKLKAGEIDIKS